MNYESFMKESSACETVYTSKISTLDFPRLLDYLLGSLEQSAPPSVKATLLTKAMLEKGQTNKKTRRESNAGQKSESGERHAIHETVRIVHTGG